MYLKNALRTSIAISMFLLVSFIVKAETVMVFSTPHLKTQSAGTMGIPFAVAIEEGVMDLYFNAGHIVFNGSLNGGYEENLPIIADRLPIRVAKSGGATILLELELFYNEQIINSKPDEKSSYLPLRIEYQLYDLYRDRRIQQGEVNPNSLRMDAIDIRTICFRLGQAVANQTVGLISNKTME